MKKIALIILDGWGIGKKDQTDGTFLANTPFVDSLYTNYPNTTLITYGEDVGLPEGQMGNSEVGHLNIGAGRVVYQDLVRINKAIQDKSIRENEALVNAFNYAKEKNVSVHFIGLVSKGGVHSMQEHLYDLCYMANDFGITQSYIHSFTDGRDTDPKRAHGYIQELEAAIENTPTKIASVIGRYYAMDRDKRWERIKKAYDLMVHGVGESYSSSVKAIEDSYNKNITDEFIEPIIIDKHGVIKEGDVVICFNFRTDRCREITMALTQQAFHEQNMHPLNLHYVTMTNYDQTFKNVNVVFDKDNLNNTLGEVISEAGLKQIRIAETEKYPHVTFFFSGGREREFTGESRIMVSSPKVATYDLHPEMSAHEITEKICAELEKQSAEFICLNFANPDMVGHTGVPEAIVKACEVVDACTKKVVEKGVNNGYSFVIIADHGNADLMINPDGTPNTAHSVNPVPCFVIDTDVKQLHTGRLADVAPTILQLMQLPQPKEMTGRSLIIS
jgi:2,3-bisphosphoglycerate-independent phosphoglycerate mutase